MAAVGRIARPHGVRGEVIVNLETDFPRRRFYPGAELFLGRSNDRVEPVRMIVATVKFLRERPVVGFEGVVDRNAAAALAGNELRIPAEQLEPLPPGRYYLHDLAGCQVATLGGEHVGQVTDVEGGLGGSRLVVATARGEVLVPLVAEICRSIDVAGKRIVIAPPEGLLDLNRRGAR
jgi:16S rRNA processing protein RimM